MNCLILTSSATSANFRVAINFAMSLNEKASLFVICTSGEKSIIKNDQISVYNVVDPRRQTILSLNRARNKGSIVARLLYRLYTYDIIPLFDSIRVSPVEKVIEKTANSIIEKEKIDYIISTNNPYFANRVSQKIKNNKQIPLIHLWLDPFNLRVFDGIIGNKALQIERSCFVHSDFVFSLPESLLGDRIALEYSSKIYTFELPFIFDRRVNRSNFDIVFAGSFSSVRNPHPTLSFILRSLSLLDSKYTFYFYCNVSESLKRYEEVSKGRIRICDYLDSQELNERLSECYMLINIGNSNSRQMPSKIVDYISYRKPIISFQQSERDSCSRYLDSYPDAFIVNTNDIIEEILAAFVHYIQKEHSSISFKELMNVPLYKNSSVSYLSEMLKTIIK